MLTKRSSRTLSLPLAYLTLLSGCVTDGVTPKVAVSLPPRPAICGAPVPGKQAFAPGAIDARVAYKIRDKELDRANARVNSCGEWYAGLRARYGQAKIK